MGLITQEERHEAVVEKWTAATDEVAEAMQENLDELNPIFMMANSGARGSFKQIRQLAGMRGLMANPKGEIIERPIKANFMEGLTVLEYFISTHGARKGLADTALRTADSGYLTRRLVDVAQDVIIREADCGTEEYIELAVLNERRRAQRQPHRALRGRGHRRPSAGARCVAEGRRRSTAPSSPRSSRPRRPTRSARPPGPGPLGAQVRGADRRVPGVLRRARWPPADVAQIGDAVGIIAAQSIGEPGTQLTMRTFHTGGVAGADITHGLPRVVELFEARKPKGLAQIAEVRTARSSIEETDKALTVVITDDAGEEHRYTFPRRTRAVRRATARRSRPARSSTRARCTRTTCSAASAARTETELYLVKEVQEVYKSQGVDINDKHIELIVRQMMKKVRVDQKGDTDLPARASSSTATSSRRSTTTSRRPRAARPRSTRRSSSASPRPR